MPVQDLIITGGSLILAAALLPTVFSKDKPALSTALLTGSILAVFAVTYLTLDLRFAAIITFVTSALWLTIAVQIVRARRS